MQKFAREQIHELTEKELREMAEAEIQKGENPCLNRLVFVETRATEKTPRKIFPAYPASILSSEHGDALVVFIVQFMMGQYSTLCIKMPFSEIGVKCRFWSLPPTESVMDAMPLKDTAEVQ